MNISHKLCPIYHFLIFTEHLLNMQTVRSLSAGFSKPVKVRCIKLLYSLIRLPSPRP